MIEWKKYDPFNPPEYGDNKTYLVSNGKHVEVAGFHIFMDYDFPGWFLPECCAIDGETDITHYAEINLPEV